MGEHPLQGLLRRAAVGLRAEVRPEALLRRRVFGDAPAVGAAQTVPGIDEVLRHDIALHLEPGQQSVEALAAVLAAVARLALQLPGQHRPRPRQGVQQILVPEGGQAVVVPGVKVVPVPPQVGEVREPRPADIARLAPEELSVGAAAKPEHGALPLPGAVLRLGEPQALRRVLLDGKPRHGGAEKGQKADVVHQVRKDCGAGDGGKVHGHAPLLGAPRPVML